MAQPFSKKSLMHSILKPIFTVFKRQIGTLLQSNLDRGTQEGDLILSIQTSKEERSPQRLANAVFEQRSHLRPNSQIASKNITSCDSRGLDPEVSSIFVIDAVGMEAHGHSIDAVMDAAKSAINIQPDRTHALRQAIHACRKAGIVSVPGVYIGIIDKFNFGQAFNKGLKFRMGQTNTQSYMKPLLKRILDDEIDPSFLISHRIKIEDANDAYKMFRDKDHSCTKIVMHMA